MLFIRTPPTTGSRHNFGYSRVNYLIQYPDRGFPVVT